MKDFLITFKCDLTIYSAMVLAGSVEWIAKLLGY